MHKQARCDGLIALISPDLCVLLMLTGNWWMEYHRLRSAHDAQALAAAGGKSLGLPSGFVAGHELLKDTEREHCRCA